MSRLDRSRVSNRSSFVEMTGCGVSLMRSAVFTQSMRTVRSGLSEGRTFQAPSIVVRTRLLPKFGGI
eukprot:5891718-Alexandrium_andersonii.AAC.1